MTVFQNIRKGLIPARLTVEEVYALTESGVLRDSEKVELIEGEVVPMAAAKADWHSIIESQLTRALVPAIPRENALLSGALNHLFARHVARTRSSDRAAHHPSA